MAGVPNEKRGFGATTVEEVEDDEEGGGGAGVGTAGFISTWNTMNSFDVCLYIKDDYIALVRRKDE